MAGFLCLAVGYVGFVMKCAQLPVLFFDMKWLNPEFKPIPYSREQFTIAALSLFLGIAISILCATGAVGALKMRHWGRRLLLWYAILGAAYTLAKSAWQISMFDFMLDFQLSTTTQPLFDRATMENRQFFALVVMTIIQLAWFASLVLLLTNRWVKESFDAAEGGTVHARGDWESTR